MMEHDENQMQSASQCDQLAPVPISRIPGFGPNTHIMTPEGEIPVEWLATGDRLITRDHGAQPILWIGRTRLDAAALEIAPETAPISIAKGALGHGCPSHPTWLAASSRVLLSGAAVELYAGVDEALSEIIHLRTPGQIDATLSCHDLCYTHILLPMHETVEANGLWAETLHLDPVARFVLADSLPPILLADPDIAHAHRQTARPCLAPWEVAAMRGRSDTSAAAELIRRVA
ncbi:MAG: Hint domain-containing protein [Maritimibacter sp.]